MPFQPPRGDVRNWGKAEWERWSHQPVTPDPGTVSTGSISGASTAPDNRFYVKRLGVMTFDGISDTDIPGAIARLTDVATIYDSLVAAIDALTTDDITEGAALYFTEVRAQAAARKFKTRAVSSADTVGATDDLLLADASGGAFSIALPAAATVPERRVTIKKIDSSGNAVTLDGNGSETIDGAATQAIATQWQSLTIVALGSAWFTV